MRSDERGFSLVELTIVLFVLSILMVVGLASYSRMTGIADDKGTQLDLLTAVKVQALHHLEAGEFTSDPFVLFDLEPTLRYAADGEPPGTMVVRIVDGRADTEVCVFSQTDHGDWFSVYHSLADGDRFGESLPVPCTPASVAGWTSQTW